MMFTFPKVYVIGDSVRCWHELHWKKIISLGGGAPWQLRGAMDEVLTDAANGKCDLDMMTFLMKW
jgi:hypothetical protein